MSLQLKYLQWVSVLTAMAYSLFVASNIGLVFLSFILLFVSAISIGLRVYFGDHRDILLLKLVCEADRDSALVLRDIISGVSRNV